ncbi:hypothetical protein HBI56_140230 [Parastagonospora nodorum]|nr:hypothetical protein HBH56_127580 [Parastagonospora nodorum]KAH3931623.1 hypothetical protein HBH54_095920 [Parastagonospora nodorum]KAH3947134.1 hypothetical protein HBH53_117870 [Parastagonospora nodorum]KAH3970551.1 hypothetical protein HBH51_114290 [Parastagonospora nodorum]KAH3971671.1 hypothetical protein HBH52_156560 [Parastagonospora nodorum]
MSENAGKSDLVSRKNEVGYDLVQSGDGCKAPNSLSEPGLWNSGCGGQISFDPQGEIWPDAIDDSGY